jgi:tripartite-type tricarboxylate transporter receptor subunit TctC
MTRLAMSFGRRRFMNLMAAAVLAGLGAPAQAQSEYPDRPVTIILPFGTGGVSDIAARLLSQHLEEALGQRFLVENQPGAGGAAATQQAYQGDREGYTLLNMGNSATIRRTLMPSLKPDQIDDFQPVSPVAEFGLVVLASPGSGIESVQDLVEKAKANPGALNIGSVAVGSTQHLTSLLFASVAGIDAQIVPYDSTPDLMGAVARGEVDAAIEIVSGAMAPIQNGQVKLIATTRKERSPVFPDAPTVEESGVAPFDVSSWNSYVAPKGAPDEVVQKLNGEIQRIIALPEVREQMLSFGMEPFEGGPEAVTARIEADVAKWRGVIEAAGMPIQQ